MKNEELKERRRIVINKTLFWIFLSLTILSAIAMLYGFLSQIIPAIEISAGFSAFMFFGGMVGADLFILIIEVAIDRDCLPASIREDICLCSALNQIKAKSGTKLMSWEDA